MDSDDEGREESRRYDERVEKEDEGRGKGARSNHRRLGFDSVWIVSTEYGMYFVRLALERKLMEWRGKGE